MAMMNRQCRQKQSRNQSPTCYDCLERIFDFLPFLRCFGAKISEIRVYYGEISKQNVYLDRYINQYCADSLTSIDLYNNNKQTFLTNRFPIPFSKVEFVQFDNADLENKQSNLVDWFPKLRSLQMKYVTFDESAIAVSFSHLEELSLLYCSIENAANLLQANRQLKLLVIVTKFVITFDKLLDMLSRNPLILQLKIFGGDADTNLIQLNRLISEHPLIEWLVLHEYRIAADDAIMLIRQLNSLKYLHFRVKDRSKWDRLVKQLDNEWNQNVSNDIYVTIWLKDLFRSDKS